MDTRERVLIRGLEASVHGQFYYSTIFEEYEQVWESFGYSRPGSRRVAMRRWTGQAPLVPGHSCCDSVVCTEAIAHTTPPIHACNRPFVKWMTNVVGRLLCEKVLALLSPHWRPLRLRRRSGATRRRRAMEGNIEKKVLVYPGRGVRPDLGGSSRCCHHHQVLPLRNEAPIVPTSERAD
ncbi:hypothetical protein DL93DRAFT_1697711 [Clavulina sp. PMI_390]|nr:hypothetical protein DL93DRAFT_1697711 [Clavulina sp. PMI_390]